MPMCGNCSRSHPTVADVKACYAGLPPSGANPNQPICTIHEPTNEEQAAAAALDAMAGVETRSGEPLWPATDKQINYVLILQDGRRLPDDWTIRDEETLRKMERDEVSSLITMLRAFPDGKVTKRQGWTMPPGKYALERGGTIMFYEVSKGKDGGRWEGYTFINRLQGAPGDYNRIEMPVSERTSVLDIIEADPKAASLRYGLSSGSCGVCASPLTNEDSLKAGIGPICRAKVGW